MVVNAILGSESDFAYDIGFVDYELSASVLPMRKEEVTL